MNRQKSFTIFWLIILPNLFDNLLVWVRKLAQEELMMFIAMKFMYIIFLFEWNLGNVEKKLLLDAH